MHIYVDIYKQTEGDLRTNYQKESETVHIIMAGNRRKKSLNKSSQNPMNSRLIACNPKILRIFDPCRLNHFRTVLDALLFKSCRIPLVLLVYLELLATFTRILFKKNSKKERIAKPINLLFLQLYVVKLYSIKCIRNFVLAVVRMIILRKHSSSSQIICEGWKIKRSPIVYGICLSIFYHIILMKIVLIKPVSSGNFTK